MNAVPAKVAGVPRVAMVVPSPGGEMNPLVLAAAHLAGVDEIYRIGGAQAVAALAYGTRRSRRWPRSSAPATPTSPPPSGRCSARSASTSIAGPSEVLVIADGDNDPEWIAADLLAQAEHDTAAQAILMTDDAGLAAARRSGRRAPARGAAARQHRRRELGDVRRHHRGALARRGARRWPTASPPSTSRSPPAIPKRWPPASATPARSSSAPTRPR